MGKAKLVEPEPAPKIVRSLGGNLFIEVTDEEKKYRNKKGPDDVKQIRKEKLKCTVCAKSVADLIKKGAEPFVHMVLGVLVCKDCSSFYGDGYFSVDEDGDDKYCRWCGQGGTLYLCSSCTCAFCKKCIKQNLDKQDVKDLESDDWKCLICNPKPLFECRTVCWFLQEHAAKTKKEKVEEIEEEDTPSSSRSKRDRGSKKSTKEEDANPVSKKRKLSEIADEVEKEKEGKRRKSSDSGKESKQQTPVSSTPSSRRSRNQATKEKENENDSEDESLKKLSVNESRPKRNRGPKSEEDLTPVKKSPRVSRKQEEQAKKRKVEEITLSENDDEEENQESEEKSPNTGVLNRSSRKDSSSTKPSRTSKGQDDEEKKERPKRVTDKIVKDSKTIESPSKRTARSVEKKSPHHASTKNKKTKKSEDDDENKSPKRSQRATKGKRSTKIEDVDESINTTSNINIQLISLDDNSDSGSDTKKRPSRRKTEIKSTPVKSKVHLAKNADSKVVQASGYINSALSDVMELSGLMSYHSEKLCTKSIATSDDVLGLFNKLKQLMTGVHSNLELIEKGLDTKINGWQGVNVQETVINNEQKMETTLLKDQENAENIIQTDEKEKEDKEYISEDKDMETTEQPKPTEQMEVEKVEEHTSENSDENMEVDNDNQDKSVEGINDENEEELDVKPENEETTKNEGEDVETIENKLESSVDSNSEEQELKMETEDKQEDANEENVDLPVPEVTEDFKEKETDCNTNDAEESITDTNLESAESKVDDENEPNQQENSESNDKENGDESQNNEIEEKSEVEENNKCVIDNVVPVCKSESLDINKSDSIDSLTKQSSVIKASNSQDNGVSDFKVADEGEESVDCSLSEERTGDEKEEVPVEVETPAVQEDSSSLPSQPKDIEELKNGTSDDEKTRTQQEEDKVKEKEPTEQRSAEKKEDEIIKSPSDEHKSSSSPHLSHTDPSRRLSGDRERGRYPQEQRWSGDRSGGWNRDHYQDRGWDRARGNNRFRYGRPNRGNWGWNH